MIPPGIPEFLSRARVVEAGRGEIVGRAWSGAAEIVGVDVSTRRRPDLGRCRARRRGARSLGVALVAVRVGRRAGRARALLPRARRGRERAAARAAVEPRRLREQRGSARGGRRRLTAELRERDLTYPLVVGTPAMLVAACSLVTALAVASSAAPSPTTTLRLDGVQFDPELALTSAQQQRGLMFRRRAPADGMLFVFPEDTSGGFWMKNTLVPLTIVFFDRSGKRVRKLLMTPCRTDPCAIYDPGRRYRFALELRASDTRRAAKLGPLSELRRLAAGRGLSSGGLAPRPRSARRGARRHAGGARPAASGRRYRSRPRPPCQLRDRADRARLVDAEDQGRRRHARGRQRAPRGGAQPARRAPAAHAPRARRRQGRHDADEDGRHEHRQRRARADREPCGRGALPPHPRGRLDRPGGARHAHALPSASEGVDGRRLRLEQAGGRIVQARAARARSASPIAGCRSAPTSPASTGPTSP